jgi:hypothetical protein
MGEDGPRIVRVTRDQIESAQLAIKLAGGEDQVEPLIVQIARAERTPRRSARRAS